MIVLVLVFWGDIDRYLLRLRRKVVLLNCKILLMFYFHSCNETDRL